MLGVLMSVRRSLILTILILAITVVPIAWGQHGTTGKVTVTALDPSGGVLQSASLELTDLSTNNVRKAETQDAGTYTFVNLPLGTYKLTVSRTGFKSQVYNNVVVQAAQTTDISATLQVGAVNETVEVTGGSAPLVETTTNAIGTTIDMKQIENLPIVGRDLTRLSTLVPGYVGTGDAQDGTWNGLPSIAQGSNIDGVIGSPGRMKFGGNAEPAVEPRLENIQEMTVQTDQLDLNQAYGTSSMQINFVTRRGTNSFHGRVYEDHRNSALNANSWFNDASTPIITKNHLILNEFGGSIGGPIIKDKLFFFGTFAMSRQPGKSNASVWFMPTATQQGNFTYTDTNGNTQTINVLQIAGSQGFPTSNQTTGNILSAVNGSLKYAQTITNTSDVNFQQMNWQIAAPENRYFPTVRVDYNATQKMRFNLAWNETKTIDPGAIAPNLPGPSFAGTGAGNKFISYTAGLGFDYTVSPTLVNEFRGGFLYNANFFGYNAQPITAGTQQISWNLPCNPYGCNTAMNGTNFPIPTGSYYPLFNASDTVTWQHSAHTLNFGFSWWREQNHYYNGVLGFPGINTGLVNGDPALNAFNSTTVPNASGAELSEAENLYAALVGRISGVGGSNAYNPATGTYDTGLGAYNLDERQKAWGLFFQDSYRIRPTLTLNYGLRWDFTYADRDLTNAYHSADPTALWGPSGIGNIFKPGTLTGTMNPLLTTNPQPYNNWFVSPQPAFGIAWNPRRDAGTLGKLLGGDSTVIRAGFSLRKFTEPQQYVWNEASDFGSFYFRSFFLNANTTGQTGTFQPGSLQLGDTLPAYGYAPQTYVKTEPVSDFTFLGGPGVNGIDPHLKQPYTESWTLGIQRQMGQTRALEVRYLGNRTLHQWIQVNPNEVNIFESHFLNEFKAAQQNLALNNANGFPNSFAYHSSIPGEQPLPIMTAAFAGEASTPDGQFVDFSQNSGFLFDVQTGQAGAFANALTGVAGTTNYYCNLVGASFAPCANNAGYTGAGAGYPINLFQVNPFATGTGFLFSQLQSAGYSNYNALQVDFRQRAWHGLQFDANYTWGHTLGLSTPNNWLGQSNLFTLRNMRLSYGPTLYDIRHAMHVSGTYDLPFGRGRMLANRGGVVDKIVGGWTIGSIFTIQSGNPFLLQGGYNTYNDYADGGVVLTGVTASQLQNAVGVYPIQGEPNVSFLNPKYLASPTGGGANQAYITPNTVPGTIGQLVYLHGPKFVNDDLSITKNIPIRESIKFNFQAMMLNAFNHPNFAPGSGSGCSYYCYASGFSPGVQAQGFAIGGLAPGYTPRIIELRANIEF